MKLLLPEDQVKNRKPEIGAIIVGGLLTFVLMCIVGYAIILTIKTYML